MMKTNIFFRICKRLLPGWSPTRKVTGICVLLLLMAAVSPAAYAQHVLNGTVTDENGEPLPGASVIIKGTNTGIDANVDGKFLLEIANPDAVLQISFLGFKTLEVAAGTERERTFVLEQDPSTLDEVTVVGYGTQKKVSVTGSIATVNMEAIERSSVPSLSNALTGRLPGIITRQSSGEPGADQAQIFIRGLGTWVNREPLILVDGVERSMDNINAQEIESFSILKDASATAVYGVRGANGVILIKTKRGVAGRPKVTFRTEAAVLTPLRLPDYIDGGEYASLMNEGADRVGHSERWSEEELQKYRDGSDPYLYPNVDWTKEIMRESTYQSISNLSVNGGNEIIRYYANVGYTQQNGIWKEDEENNDYPTNTIIKRYNFRSNVDVNLTDDITLALGVGGIIRQGNYSAYGGDYVITNLRRTTPIAFPIRNPDGTPGGTLTSIGNNPVAVNTQSGYSTHLRNTLQGTFSGRWDLASLVTPGLSLSGKFAYDHYYAGAVNRHKVFAIKQYLGVDPETGEDRYRLHREEQPLGYYVTNSSNRALYTELIANYVRSFGDHSVTGMFLYNQRDYIDINASTSIGNLPYRRQGVAARLTYGYKGKYLAEFNMGYNGSENFPEGKRFGFFPSVSGGWVISNEDFWNSDSKINQLKIRASYGQVGNDQIGRRFLFLTTVNTGGGYFFGDSQIWWSGLAETQMGSSDVTWEVANKFNAGIDMEMFNSKLVFQLDFFSEFRDRILIQRRTIPDLAGFVPTSVPFGNLGKARNKGIDGMLEFKNTTKNGWFYSFRGNFTFAHNTVLENDEPQPRFAYQSAKGHSIDQPLGLIALGLFQDDEEIQNSPRQTFTDNVLPGDVKYKDVNDDGVIDDFDRVPIGLPRTPEIMYGFGGTVAYKGFDVSVFFSGAARTSFHLNGESIWPFYKGQGAYNVLQEYYDNRWTPETPNAKYPAATDDLNTNNYRQSTLYMYNGAYMRLKNAEIAYNFSGPAMERAGIGTLRVFVNGLNLYTWDHIKVVDPESNNGVGRYPLQRSINFGLQVNFR